MGPTQPYRMNLPDVILSPGLVISQAMHLVAAALLVTMQVSQSQESLGFLNIRARLESPVEICEVATEGCTHAGQQ